MQFDEELDELISRIKLEEGNTEFWKRRFLGEGVNENYSKPLEVEGYEVPDVSNDVDVDVGDDVVKETEDDDEEEEEVEQTENQVGDRIKDKEVEAAKPPQMIGVQLFKDLDQITSSSRKSKRRSSRASLEVKRLIPFLINISKYFFVCYHMKCAHCLGIPVINSSSSPVCIAS